MIMSLKGLVKYRRCNPDAEKEMLTDIYRAKREKLCYAGMVIVPSIILIGLAITELILTWLEKMEY